MAHRLPIVSLAVLISCASTSKPAEPQPTPPPSSPSAPATFRLQPENPDEDPAFRPALAATIPQNAPADTIAFGWKAPCEVPARSFKYRSDKGSGITRMRVVFEQRGDTYQVQLRDLDFERLNGQAIDTPELRAQVASVLALTAAAMPSFIISKDGEYLTTVGMEEMIKALQDALGGRIPPNVMAAVQSPEMLQQLDATAGDDWGTWVALWNGRTLAPGATQVEQHALAFFGDTLTVDATIEHLGTLDDAPNLRLLRTKSALEGEKAVTLMRAQMRKLAEQTGGPPMPDNAIESVRRVTDLYVAIDPDGALPHRTRRETLIQVNDKERLEIQEWEFDWAHAKGCR